ncbi:MAG: flagellar basal body rod protein FlgC [Gammaproteobacteria bacterium]|nr:flagellar basal body rod protein FlgC [Gammaproteobacteria bacterium]
MSLFSTFDVAGSALSAQSLRLNLTASNLANMNNVAGDPANVYQPRYPVFRAQQPSFADAMRSAGVEVLGVFVSQAPPIARDDPGHPEANEDGIVYASNVNLAEEMANMISASRSYQSNLEVINTAKELLSRTLSLGQG